MFNVPMNRVSMLSLLIAVSGTAACATEADETSGGSGAISEALSGNLIEVDAANSPHPFNPKEGVPAGSCAGGASFFANLNDAIACNNDPYDPCKQVAHFALPWPAKGYTQASCNAAITNWMSSVASAHPTWAGEGDTEFWGLPNDTYEFFCSVGGFGTRANCISDFVNYVQ